MRETWYLLEDGSVVDPNDVAPDETGALRHKDGVAVAMRGDAPSSRGVDLDENRLMIGAEPGSAEMTAAPPKKAYTTRESRSK
ncbi:MAG: hypothetical protein ACOYM5_02790 [Caulobacter sp.]